MIQIVICKYRNNYLKILTKGNILLLLQLNDKFMKGY